MRHEIKNVNSLKSLGRAIEYEANRHISLYENGESPKQETRHWDEDVQEELVPADQQRKMLKITVISLNRT